MNICLFIDCKSTIGISMYNFLHKNIKDSLKIVIIKNYDYLPYETLFIKTDFIKYDEENVLKVLAEKEIKLNVISVFHLIPKSIWNYPLNGTINLHYSTLPKYRGPYPVYWALHFKDKNIGVSVCKISDKIDGGEIYYQKKYKIGKKTTVESITNFLIPYGETAILSVINDIKNNKTKIIDSKYDSSYFSKKDYIEVEMKKNK